MPPSPPSTCGSNERTTQSTNVPGINQCTRYQPINPPTNQPIHVELRPVNTTNRLTNSFVNGGTDQSTKVSTNKPKQQHRTLTNKYNQNDSQPHSFLGWAIQHERQSVYTKPALRWCVKERATVRSVPHGGERGALDNFLHSAPKRRLRSRQEATVGRYSRCFALAYKGSQPIRCIGDRGRLQTGKIQEVNYTHHVTGIIIYTFNTHR